MALRGRADVCRSTSCRTARQVASDSHTSITWLSGPCSAWERRSAAAKAAGVVLSAMTITSEGPAGMSMATVSALSSCLAVVTYWLPGPKILSTRGTLSVPYAMAAMAWAPPSRKTRWMPQQAAAYSTSGLWAGVHSTTSGQPAICAGRASMSTVEKRGALPPGMYRPTRPMGTGRWMQVTPGAVSKRISRGCWAWWKERMFLSAWEIASFTSRETFSPACRISAWLTSMASSGRPSISRERARRAWSPCSFTRCRMPLTRSSTTGLSEAGRRHRASQLSRDGFCRIWIIY